MCTASVTTYVEDIVATLKEEILPQHFIDTHAQVPPKTYYDSYKARD